MLRPTEADMATRPMFPRNPWPSSPRPLSVPEYGPAKILEDSETMTQWSAYGTLNAVPFAGGYDTLQGRMMRVSQADLYDASPNPWPNNGQFDKPSGFWSQLIQIPREGSAHRGMVHPVGAGPAMLFHAPPIFGLQTKPIPAVGI